VPVFKSSPPASVLQQQKGRLRPRGVCAGVFTSYPFQMLFSSFVTWILVFLVQFNAKYNGMIPEPLPVYCDSFMSTAVANKQ